MTQSDRDYAAKRRYAGQRAASYVEDRARAPKWKREQKMVARLVDGMPPGRSILDVPFGTGRFATIYQNAGIRTYGTDISSDMLAQARRWLGPGARGVALFRSDAEQLALKTNAVDCIICVRLLNLVSFDIVRKLLGEFARVAKQEIIVEVRVERRFVGMLIRRVHAFLSWPGSVFALVARWALRRAIDRRRDGAGLQPASSARTFNHPEEELLDACRSHELVVSRMLTLPEPEAPGRWIRRPLRFLVLEKSGKVRGSGKQANTERIPPRVSVGAST